MLFICLDTSEQGTNIVFRFFGKQLQESVVTRISGSYQEGYVKVLSYKLGILSGFQKVDSLDMSLEVQDGIFGYELRSPGWVGRLI